MQQGIFTIIENSRIASGTKRLRLRGDCSAIKNAGQFVNLRIEGQFLRRPLSVSDLDGDVLTLVYKQVGEGTKRLAEMGELETLDLLTGLGNGFDLSPAGAHPVLIGGGVGASPMLLLARELKKRGCRVTAVLGFETIDEIFYERELKSLGADVITTTVDGSYGVRGFVTDALKDIDGTYFYACGPEPMLKALCALPMDGQLSFDRRMGCGFGACMGCTCRTITGGKRICKEGPVLRKEELIWED